MSFPALGFGDPHISTLDGLGYSFNGIGEYWMTQTKSSEFSLQSRTALAYVSIPNFNPGATVYAGFAAKSKDSDKIEVSNDSLSWESMGRVTARLENLELRKFLKWAKMS